jgi:hypothetical protein
MCIRRFQLLSKIETATVEEIKSYLTRSVRIYLLFSIIDLVLLFVGSHSGIISILQVVFYIITTILLYLVVKTTTPFLVVLSMMSFTGILLLNVANIVLLAISGTATATIATSAALAFLSILIGSTTLYILYKLRQKMTNDNNDTKASQSNQNANLDQSLLSDKA